MARLYADEQFPLPAVTLLRDLGHEILTVQESARSGTSDENVLEFAISERRIVLTQNRRHFIRLHARYRGHYGIIVCTEDRYLEGLARRIHRAIIDTDDFTDKLIRVNRLD